VKTFEINLPGTSAAQNDPIAIQDPNAELKQRLWELLLPLPEAAAVQAKTGAATRASTTDGQHARGARANTLGSELITTAYVLAGHIQQLTLWGETSAAVSAPDDTGAPRAPAYTVQLESAADGGGRASVELAHPELGAVALSVEMSAGAVRVTATAENERSAQVIAQGQAVLAERLAQQGVALEALDVIVTPKRRTRSRLRARARARREET
jgi:flagellar hook-length control protein FliK